MSQREEEIVREFLDARMAGDIDGSLDFLTEDAEYRIPAWKEPLRGLDSIRSELERWQGTLGDTHYELRNVASTDHVVLSERIDTQYMTQAGIPRSILSECTNSVRMARS
jgi:limonene-1,2-epoxide hydrolase